MNGKVYDSGDVEIPASVWQSWENHGGVVFLPADWNVIFRIENKSAEAIANMSVQMNLRGGHEKNFSAVTINGRQSQEFEIPIGNLPFVNGDFKMEIWLRDSESAPLFGFWNGKNFGNKGTIRLHLMNFSEWRVNQK